MNKLARTGVRIAPILLIAALPLDSHALDLSVLVGYEAEYTNNTALTPTDENSEWIQTPQATVNLSHEGASTTATVNYNVSRQIHQDDTFSDQTNAVGNANVTWRAIADRLSFDASSASTLTTIDAQTPDVPTNQQVTSTTTAGSSLSLDGPSNHDVNLRYEYAFSNAHDTDTDSRRQTGTAAYVVPLTSRRRIQLNGSLGHVDYDSPQYSDYDVQTGDLQFVNQGDSIELDTRVGYSTSKRDDAGDVSGAIGNFDVIWNTSDTTNINASFARSIQDQSQNVTAGIPEFGENFVVNSGVTTPYTLDAYTLGISTQLGHNVVDLVGNITSQDYDSGATVSTAPDQDTKGVTLGVTRPLRQTLTAQLYANYTDTDFDDGDRQKYYSTGIRFDWRHWRNLSISTATAYTKQTSDVEASEYNEWIGSITLMYTVVGGRTR